MSNLIGVYCIIVFAGLKAGAQFESPADNRNDCSNKVDGVYMAEPCAEYYHACRNRETLKISCSESLWFNPQKLQCDFKENIIECTKKDHCGLHSTGGAYADGCSSIFWYCNDGHVAHSSCPVGLYFDVDMKRCNYKMFVRACGGDPNATVPSSSTEPSEGLRQFAA